MKNQLSYVLFNTHVMLKGRVQPAMSFSASVAFPNTKMFLELDGNVRVTEKKRTWYISKSAIVQWELAK